MRERHLLQDRIELLGLVKHSDVHGVCCVRSHGPSISRNYTQILLRGAIFLNTALTEAFGTAILEAACAGLYVVSTKVGGVPEVLPPDMISFAMPDQNGTRRNYFGSLSSDIREYLHRCRPRSFGSDRDRL